MSNFNYEKAYCVFAVPSFESLSFEAKDVHSKLISLVGELNQGKDCNIPMTQAVESLINYLPTKQIAELSRLSYFIGHWKPLLLPALFENNRGESWKISNCCDQVLRKRLKTPNCVQIHNGKLRVTFSSRNCWLWEEFGLAIEENLEIFKSCPLSFSERALEKSAKKLAKQIGDLWGNVDEQPNNKLYLELLELKKEARKKKIERNFQNKIESLRQKQADIEEEIKALLWLNEKGFQNFDNVIYYRHTKRFCFGWCNSIKSNKNEYNTLCELLEEFPFDYDIK